MDLTNTGIEAAEIAIRTMHMELAAERTDVKNVKNKYMDELLSTSETESALKEEIDLLQSIEYKLNVKELFYTELEMRFAEIESENVALQLQIQVTTSQNEAMKTMLQTNESEQQNILEENAYMESQLVANHNFEQDLSAGDDSVQESIKTVHLLLNELQSEQENISELNEVPGSELLKEIDDLNNLLVKEVEEKNVVKAECFNLKEMNAELQKYINDDPAHGKAVLLHQQATDNFEALTRIMQSLTDETILYQAEFTESISK